MENFKIEFYDKETGKLVDYQGRYYVDRYGDVFMSSIDCEFEYVSYIFAKIVTIKG